MKKFFLIGSVLYIFLFLFVFSCKREEFGKLLETEKLKVYVKGSLRLDNPLLRIADTVDISSQGYLIIHSTDELEIIKAYLTSYTHGQVKAYLSTEGFSSYGSTIYGTSYNAQAITIEQAANYILSSHRIVQIEGVLFKPIVVSGCSTRSWDYVLLMDTSYLTASSLGDLEDGVFDPNAMNKLATDPISSDYGDTRHLVDSVGHGFQETATDCSASNSRRPMFGLSGGCCIENGSWFNAETGIWETEYWACPPHYYFFWIMIDNNGGCGPVYNCSGWPTGSNCASNPY